MGSLRNTPPSSRNPKTLHDLFVQEKPLFPIQQSPTSSMNEDLLSAISYCTYVFTFTDPLESPAQRDSKRLQLSRLISILKSSKKPLQPRVLAPLISMISANLFRPLPPPANNPSCSSSSSSSSCELAEDEDPVSIFSPVWSHLQIVYEILLRVVITIDHEVLRVYMDNSFLLKLLSLFQSEDPRERESLKSVYHKIYSKFIKDRSLMRKSMKDVLLNHVFEIERHPGIAELLEIWGTIINGFTVPLKEEHKLFLMRVLIPLHKTKGMQYRKLALPLCTQITKCINSWNSQVAERALYLWNNEQFVKMATIGMVEVFPVIVEGMERNLKWHWSKNVRQLTESVKVMLEEMDPELYTKGLIDMQNKQAEAHQQDIRRKKTWERLELEAERNNFLNPQRSICVSH
ncbi:hypothetical protein PIB30_030796 [Stylosanthes scabra]|uniref:Serine/threonine protein phosphatase 2A regulatory subunit n=1 Tax=Stylosanthes scabra TaxID=79078 RepID=A0ABU6QBZ7_9FABA|nr:hypothetical protein [Stylosanthes scabra]